MSRRNGSNGRSNAAHSSDGLLPDGSEEYVRNPDCWWVPATDSKGHGVPKTVRIPPGLDRQIRVEIAKHPERYQTDSDLIRHAIVRHLEWLAHIDGDAPGSFLHGVLLMNQEMADAEFNTRMVSTLTRLEGIVEQYAADGEMGEVMRLMANSRRHLENMRESPIRTKYLKRFQALYEKHFPSAAVSTPESEWT